MSRTVFALAVTLALVGCEPARSPCTSFDPSDRGPSGDGNLSCSPAEEGTSVCPGGVGSGTGYTCSRGCWQRFFDGPCAPFCWSFPERCDAGLLPSCRPTVGLDAGTSVRTCSPEQEGDLVCPAGWMCQSGCWNQVFDACGFGCDGDGAIAQHCSDGSSAGTCVSGARCEAARVGATGDVTRLGADFGVPVGEPDPDHPGFFRAAASGEDPPVPIGSGSFCVRRCDVEATSDECGPCATCSAQVGDVGLVELGGVLPPEELDYGPSTGWCRADCTFDAAAVGSCPEGHTCSPASRTCVEGCTSDLECQARIVPTWDGDRVSVLDVPATCDPTTLRCRWAHAGGSSVGDPCAHRADCTDDVGVCLPGGTCGELDCAFAADTTSDQLCDGGRGVCLGYGGNMASVCVEGCTDANDCLPGNACNPFDETTAGPYSGYCAATCDSAVSSAGDTLVPCRAEERCDMPPATAEEPDPFGTCRAPCATDADCAVPTRCAIEVGAGEGVCRPPTR